MIDLNNDEAISLSQLASRLHASNQHGRVNPSTVFRWATKGLRGHKLEVVHIGGRMLTTWAAYLAFNEAIAGGKAPEPAARPARQTRRVRDAKKILADAGIG